VTRTLVSRRSLLTATAATLACGRQKATGFHGICFVANQEGRTVAAVDLTHFKVRKHISLDGAPSSVLPHPSAPRVFVLAPENGVVYDIDAGALAVSRRVRAGNSAVQMQFAPDGKALWVLYRDPASLVEIRLDSFRPGRRIRLSGAPHGFDLSSDGVAAIALPESRSVVLAALEGGAPERTMSTGDVPSLLRFQGDNRQLLVGSRPEKTLSIFQVASGKVVVRLPLPVAPRHFVFNDDRGQLFISGDGMDAVVHVYPFRTEIAETMLAGRAPDYMAVSSTPAFLLVANPQADSITILDFDSMGRKLVASVQVGRDPRYILVTPDQQYALVLNQGSGDMAVIRIRPLASQDASRRYRPTPLFTMIPVGEQPVSAGVVAFT
jgi:DNA-binding beta-propeller fold protein YncE